MAEFKEVSLGFAEFVSQLIQETFDAIISSQNYQTEKYAELLGKLNLPSTLYAERFVTADMVEDKLLDYFGIKVAPQISLPEDFETFLQENFENAEKLSQKGKLTALGFEAVKGFITNLLVEEQKEILNTMLNNSGVSKLVVDSGEITAKLELTNLYSGEAVAEKEKNEKVPPTKIKTEIGQPTVSFLKGSLPGGIRKDIKVLDIKDIKTGRTTILIDKKNIKQVAESNYQIPDVRLSAQPAKISGSSNLYSEIKINFKTV